MRECLWHRVWEVCRSVWMYVREWLWVCLCKKGCVKVCIGVVCSSMCVKDYVCKYVRVCVHLREKVCKFEREIMCLWGGVYACGVQRSPLGIAPQEPPTFFEAGSLTSMAFTTQVGLAGQWAPGIHVVLPSHHWGAKECCSARAFHMGSGDRTQVFLLAGQTLYQLN